MLPGGTITGKATDDFSGLASLTVKFSNGFGSSTANATITCAEPKTNCSWSVRAPYVIGTYKATAVGVDRAGNAQNPGTVDDVSVLS